MCCTDMGYVENKAGLAGSYAMCMLEDGGHGLDASWGAMGDATKQGDACVQRSDGR